MASASARWRAGSGQPDHVCADRELQTDQVHVPALLDRLRQGRGDPVNGLSFDPLLPLPVALPRLRCWRADRDPVAVAGAGGAGWRGLAGPVGGAGTGRAGAGIRGSAMRFPISSSLWMTAAPASLAGSDRAIGRRHRGSDAPAPPAGDRDTPRFRGDDADGTLIGTALTRALAAEPQARVAGVIAVTDGLAHDAAMVPAGAPRRSMSH